MKTLYIIATVMLGGLAFACGGSDPPPPAVVTPTGETVPLPSEDGELEEGEVEVERDDGETEVEVETDD